MRSATSRQNVQLMSGLWNNAEMAYVEQLDNKLARIRLVSTQALFILKHGQTVSRRDETAYFNELTIETVGKMRRARTWAVADYSQIVFQLAVLVEKERAGKYG